MKIHTPAKLKRGLCLFCALGALFLSGCASVTPFQTTVRPPLAGLFVSVKAPLTTDFNGNPCGTKIKKVSSSNTSYFRDFIFTGLDFAWDDAAIQQIARQGGIEHVSYADYEIFNLLGVYGTFTVNVYGY